MRVKGYTYQSPIYRQFRSLDRTDRYAIVRHIERNLEQFYALPFDEHFEMLYWYADALKGIHAYKRLAPVADRMAELAIVENIERYEDKDVYLLALSYKAETCYQLGRYEEAAHVLRELLRLHPEDKVLPKLLTRTYLRTKPPYVRHMRALGVLLFLSSAFLVIGQIIVINTFYEEYSRTFEVWRYTLFASAVAMLGLSELGYRGQVYWRVRSLLRQARKRRKAMEQS